MGEYKCKWSSSSCSGGNAGGSRELRRQQQSGLDGSEWSHRKRSFFAHHRVEWLPGRLDDLLGGWVKGIDAIYQPPVDTHFAHSGRSSTAG